MALVPAPVFTLTTPNGHSYALTRSCLAPSEFLSSIPDDEDRIEVGVVPIPYVEFVVALLRRLCGKQVPIDYGVLGNEEEFAQYVEGYFGIDHPRALVIDALGKVGYTVEEFRHAIDATEVDNLGRDAPYTLKALARLQDDRLTEYFADYCFEFAADVVLSVFPRMNVSTAVLIVKARGVQSFVEPLREIVRASPPDAAYSDIYLSHSYLGPLIHRLAEADDEEVDAVADRMDDLDTWHYVGICYWIEKYRLEASH